MTAFLSLEKYGADYPFLVEHLERQNHIDATILDAIRAYTSYISTLHLPRGSRVLDIGACTGTTMNYLKRMAGWKMFGIDLSFAAIKAGNELYGKQRLATADAQSLPFRTNSFGAVISQDLLEHIPEDQLPLAIHEMGRVCNGNRMVHKVTVLEDTEWIDNDDTHATKQPAEWWQQLFEDQGWRTLADTTQRYIDRYQWRPVFPEMHGFFLLERIPTE